VVVWVRCHSGGPMFSVQGTGGVYKANAFLRREVLAGYACSASPVARFAVRLEDLVRAVGLAGAMGSAGPGAPAVRLTYPGPDATLVVAVAGEGGQGYAMDTERVVRTTSAAVGTNPAVDAFRLEDGGEVVATFVILTDALRRAVEDLEWLGAKAPVTMTVYPPSPSGGEGGGGAEVEVEAEAGAGTGAEAGEPAVAPLMPATAVHAASRGGQLHRGRVVLRGGNEWGGAMEVELAWPAPGDGGGGDGYGYGEGDERGQDASALSGFSSFSCVRPVTHRYVLKHLMQAMCGYTGSAGHGAGGEGGAKQVPSVAHAALSKVKVNEVGEMLIQQMVPFPAGRGWGDDAEAEGGKAFLDFVVLPMEEA